MDDHPIILFDGVCNFCNGSVNLLIRLDKKSVFRFTPLQSEKGLGIIEKLKMPTIPDSFLLLHRNKLYDRSSAALKTLSFLPWYWQWTQVFWLIPKFLRDGVYNFIAKKRYQWFGKKDECMMPGPGIRNRFL